MKTHLLLITLLMKASSLMAHPFSFTEIMETPLPQVKEPAFVEAKDSCRLAYYLYAPEEPRAICLFYPGAGFYGDALHQRIAKELAERDAIATYTVDIRGHGNSEGNRGDSPSIESVWDDVSVMARHARQQFPNLPIYLAGHSSGAGLLLNYAAWPEREDFDGLILLAPYLGAKSGVLKVHENPEQEFAKYVRTWVYIVGGMSGGYFCGNTAAVYFNYPFELLNDELILPYYTFNMSMATTPYETSEVLAAITVPTAMLIAAEDEQFHAQLLAAQVNLLPSTTWRHSEIVDSKHLTILLQASDLIAATIDKMAEAST